MPQTWTVTSYSIPKTTHRRLRQALPRHGDRSRLVSRLLEMWLAGEVSPIGLYLRSKPHLPFNVAQSNITEQQWQQP